MKLFKKKKTKVIAIILTVAVLLTAGFFIYKKIKSNTKAQTNQELIMETKSGTIRETVSTSGTIETANYLTVTTSVNGIVKEVYVKEGDSVTKGQSIMAITLNAEGEESLADAWGSYLSAESALESAKNSQITYETALINAEEAFNDEKEDNSYQSHDERIAYAVSENAYEVAKFNYDNQANVIEQKQIALSKAWLTYQAQSPTIVAPDSGVVANIVVVEGMEISNSLSERTSSTVASIKKEGTPIASLNVSEVDINKVAVGQKVELTLSSISNQTFIGEVVGIDRIGTSSSGVSNYPVIVKFDAASDLVLPNMGVDANIIIQEHINTVYVPASAVLLMQGKTVVRVKDGNNVTTKEVEIGIETTEYTEILSGIEVGTKVIVDTLPTSGFTTNDSESENRGGMIMGVSRPGGK